MFTVSRSIEGVSLNPQEYLLNPDGSLMTFDSQEAAITFMKEHGWNDDALDFLNIEEIEPEAVKNFFK